jgi:predicted acyl esterase
MNARITRRRLALPAWACCCLLWLWTAPAYAAVVQRGFITLHDGTQLNYILTLPDASGKYPVALTYDPYAAGYNTGSDLPALSVADWNKAGYAHLGVNFRGTGCSSGTFEPLNAPQWGADGAEVVEWAAAQPWSTGRVGMFGFSFPGVSQLATAAYASPHLAAIAPWNVFSDFYRDFVYPGGILNSFVPLWVLAGRDYVAIAQGGVAAEPVPQCELYQLLNQPGDDLQVIQVVAHPYDDADAIQPARPHPHPRARLRQLAGHHHLQPRLRDLPRQPAARHHLGLRQ